MYDEIKRVLKHSSIYGLASMLSKAVGFIMIPVYTRFLTPADYGIIEMLDLTSYVVSTIVGFCISTSIVRFYYEYPEGKERNTLVSTALISVAGIASLAILILLPFAALFSELILKSRAYAHLFMFTFVTILFQILAEDCLVFLQVKQKSASYAAFYLVRLILGLGLNILMVVRMRMGVLGIVSSGLITAALVSITLSALTLRETGVGFSREKLDKMFRYGMPLIFASFSTFIVTFSDRYFLNWFSDLSQVGIYSLGYKMSMLIAVFVTSPFNMTWAPKRFEIAKRPDALDISKRIFTYFAFAAVFAGLGLSMLIGDVLKVITTPAFYGAAKVVPVLTAGYILNGFYYHLNYGIYLKTKTRYIGGIWLSAAAFNLGCNFLLIRSYHSMGAAWATTLTYLYIAVVTYIVSRRLYPIPYEFGRFVKICLVAAAVYYGSSFVRLDFWVASAAAKTGLLLLFPLGLYITGFLTHEESATVKKLASKLGRRAAPAAPATDAAPAVAAKEKTGAPEDKT